jgi:hypothetical protein
MGTKRKKKRPKVYGDRTCLQCKGICHEGSLRNKVPKGYGFRSHYFCSPICFKNYEEQKARKFFREKSKLTYAQADDIIDSAAFKKSVRERMKKYERVDCITR